MNEEITGVGVRKWVTGAILAAVALVVSLLLLPGVSHALTDGQKALAGLRGMQVVVEKMDPQAERLGLAEDQIKTDVELRRRKAGIRGLTKKERFETPGMPCLYKHWPESEKGQPPGDCQPLISSAKFWWS